MGTDRMKGMKKCKRGLQENVYTFYNCKKRRHIAMYISSNWQLK